MVCWPRASMPWAMTMPHRLRPSPCLHTCFSPISRIRHSLMRHIRSASSPSTPSIWSWALDLPGIVWHFSLINGDDPAPSTDFDPDKVNWPTRQATSTLPRASTAWARWCSGGLMPIGHSRPTPPSRMPMVSTASPHPMPLPSSGRPSAPYTMAAWTSRPDRPMTSR